MLICILNNSLKTILRGAIERVSTTTFPPKDVCSQSLLKAKYFSSKVDVKVYMSL